MTRYFYDLHIHSCLSPCADDDMTPANIAGMAHLSGLQIVALTDHNACGNCAVFMDACEAYGIVGVPGMELTTAEEIHMVCLFPTLEAALVFDGVIAGHRLRVKNKPEIFGRQLLVNAEDEVIGEEPYLLSLATDLPIEEAYAQVVAHGGAAYPAHIDRQANGIIAVLGTVPEQPEFAAVELQSFENTALYQERHGLENKRILYASDAHTLGRVQDAEFTIGLQVQDNGAQQVCEALVRALRGEQL